ncbi:MAG: LemA family protein [Thermoplasmatota archaeon]
MRTSLPDLAAAMLTLVALVVLGLGVYAILLYNSLRSLRNETDRAWANIDVLLKQRADEIPNVVAVVRGYAAHEATLFQAVAAARAGVLAASSPGGAAQAHASMSEAQGRLFAVAEAYPQLQASASFLSLQKRLSTLEDMIADRREYYNAVVANFNTRIQDLPDRLVATRMGLTTREYFEARGSERTAPVVPALGTGPA